MGAILAIFADGFNPNQENQAIKTNQKDELCENVLKIIVTMLEKLDRMKSLRKLRTLRNVHIVTWTREWKYS